MRQASASAHLLSSPASPGLAHTSNQSGHLPARTSPKHSFFPEGRPGPPTRKQRPLPTAGACARAVPASPRPGRRHLRASVRRLVAPPFTPCRCRRCRGSQPGRRRGPVSYESAIDVIDAPESKNSGSNGARTSPSEARTTRARAPRSGGVGVLSRGPRPSARPEERAAGARTARLVLEARGSQMQETVSLSPPRWPLHSGGFLHNFMHLRETGERAHAYVRGHAFVRAHAYVRARAYVHARAREPYFSLWL